LSLEDEDDGDGELEVAGWTSTFFSAFVLFFFLWLSVRCPPCVSLFSPSLFCLSFVFFFSGLSLSAVFFPPSGLAFYRARTNGCSPIRLFFPGRRISLGVSVFCLDLDARFDPYLPGIAIFMKIGINLYVLVGLRCRHYNLFPFFAGGFAASEEEEKEPWMFETTPFWTGMTLFNLVLEASEFSKKPPEKTMIRPLNLLSVFKTVLDFNFNQFRHQLTLKFNIFSIKFLILLIKLILSLINSPNSTIYQLNYWYDSLNKFKV